MAVQGGAPRRNNDLVDEIMEQARSQAASGSGESGGVKAFSGRSNRLTDPDSPKDHNSKKEKEVPVEEEEQEVAVRTITFWSDGFTLEPVPTLRPFTDPHSISLLSSIRSGLAPLHELGVLPGQAVEMRVVQRDGEVWSKEGQERIWKEVREAEDRKEGKKAARPFSGASHRLGDLPTKPTCNQSAVQGNVQLTRLSGGFNAGKPSTKIQFRLDDGSKHTVQFNPDQTVADIYETVSEILGGRQVGVLLSGRPPVALPSKELTLKEAGLEGSLIIQQQSS